MAATERIEFDRLRSEADEGLGSVSECPNHSSASEAPERIFEHIHLQLKALEDVPKQLHSILDSVAHLRSQLEELRRAGAPPGEGRGRMGHGSRRAGVVDSACGGESSQTLTRTPSMSVALARIAIGQKTNRRSSMLSDRRVCDDGSSIESVPIPDGTPPFTDLHRVSSEDPLDPVLPNTANVINFQPLTPSASNAAAYGGARSTVPEEPALQSHTSSQRSSCTSVASPAGREGSMQRYFRLRRKSSRVRSDSTLMRSSLASPSQSENISSEAIAGWSLCVKSKVGSSLERTESMCIDIAATFDLQTRSSPLILLPNGRFRLAWTTLLVCLTVFVAVCIPVRLAYFDTSTIKSGVVGHMLQVADACWVIDIIINFHTAFYWNGILVCRQWHIAANYARTWLVLDLIASYPLVLASTDVAIRTCGFLKLVRLSRLGSQLSSIQKECRFAKLLPVKAVLIAALLSHALSCVWRMVQHADDADDPAVKESPRDEWWADYVADLYWLQMTMTTVGYGDIVPRGTSSRLFAIAVMLVAPIFVGSVVSVLGHVTGGILSDEEEKQASEADRLMQRHGVPIDLRRRVDHNLRHHIRQEDQIMTATKLLGKLSPGMQRELSLEFLGNTMMRFPLFQGAPRAFIADVAQAHAWLQYLPGNLVVEEGQPVQELVFVVHGLIMKQPHGEGEVDVDLCKEEFEAGSWFGEVCLFQADTIREFSAYAVVESELAVLAANEYARILQKYPPQLARHRVLERGVHSKELSLKGLTCVPRRIERSSSAISVLSFSRRRGND